MLYNHFGINAYMLCSAYNAYRISKVRIDSNDENQDGRVKLYPILFTQYDSNLYKQSTFRSPNKKKDAKLKAISLTASSTCTIRTAIPTTSTRYAMATIPPTDDRDMTTLKITHVSLQSMESEQSKSLSHTIDELDNQNGTNLAANDNDSDINSSETSEPAKEAREEAMVDSLPQYSAQNDCNRKLCIGASGIVFVIFGITILVSFISYIENEYNNKCLNLNVDLIRLEESRANYSSTLDPWLINNPEMIFYDAACKHKVVNIFGQFPCNCRVLSLASDKPNGYWFNQNDLESMLLRFDDLEAFAVNFYTGYTIFLSRLNNTFYLSHKMLKNHNHLTTLLFGELNFKYINGIEQVKNLEILSIRLSFETIEFPFESIATLSNLKVLFIHQVPWANNTHIDKTICNLKQLTFFDIDYMEKLSAMPFDCIADSLDKLFHFSMTYMLLIEDIDPKFWNMDSIQSIFLDFSHSLKQSNFDFDTFTGYSEKLEKVTIQAPSQVCQSSTSTYQNIIIDQQQYSGFGYLYDNLTKINNNNITLVPYNRSLSYVSTLDYMYNYNSSSYINQWSFVSDSDSSGLLKFIKQFDPCLAPCSTGITSYLCPTKQHGDGVCNTDCNNAECGFDGGDCAQTCNLYIDTSSDSNSDSDFNATTCTLDTWQMDGICNTGCNNSLCNYDFEDCIYKYTKNDTCNNLLYDIENVTCYSDWTDDLWCDSHCEQLLCEHSNSGCATATTPCYSSSTCRTVHSTIITLLAAIYPPKELITLNEVCEYFQLLALVSETDTQNLNCSQAFDIADLNNNGYIGFWEAIVYTAEYWGLYGAVHWEKKIEQIDCSSCLQNASLYWW